MLAKCVAQVMRMCAKCVAQVMRMCLLNVLNR